MKNKYTIIGLMTGTSLDGIDLSIVDFFFDGKELTFDERFFKTYDYSDEIKNKILEIIESKIPIYKISQLNFALSRIYADCIEQALRQSQISKSEILVIGVHGQTIWHQPLESKFADMKLSSTFQAANISALSAFTEIPVVGDFRSADVALGGQGAPLVPIFDFYFLRSNTENNICLNIGGIANITYLPKNCDQRAVIGFDTGPGNILIDIACKRYYNLGFDKNGGLARKGNLDTAKLEELIKEPYIYQAYPKSTGREYFNEAFFDKYFHNYSNKNDAICTLTHFTAKSIAENVIKNNLIADNIIVSGGGAKNSFLMELLQNYIPNSKVRSSEYYNINIDSKEAICFAFLALLNILELNGNLPSVTNAKKQSILGVRAGRLNI